MSWLSKLILAVALVLPLKATASERECLALNVYYEAGSESTSGKLAVARVTLNRLKAPNLYGKTICQIVYRPKQFSWVGAKLGKKNGKLWAESLKIADRVMSGEMSEFKATHFHSLRVRPAWAKRLTRITKIGNHVFYYDPKLQ
jgi:spore germination cell wall hydrolase CwlJ-like protein